MSSVTFRKAINLITFKYQFSPACSVRRQIIARILFTLWNFRPLLYRICANVGHHPVSPETNRAWCLHSPLLTHHGVISLAAVSELFNETKYLITSKYNYRNTFTTRIHKIIGAFTWMSFWASETGFHINFQFHCSKVRLKSTVL